MPLKLSGQVLPRDPLGDPPKNRWDLFDIMSASSLNTKVYNLTYSIVQRMCQRMQTKLGCESFLATKDGYFDTGDSWGLERCGHFS